MLLLPDDDEGNDDNAPSPSALALALDLSAPPPSAPGAPSVPTLAAAAGERSGWDARLRVGAAGAFIVEAGGAEPVLTARRFADARPPAGPDAALSPCPDAATADVAWRPGATPAPASLGDGAWAAVRAHAAAAAAAVDTAAQPPPPPPPFETDARALAGLLLRIVAADVRLALAPADVAVLSAAAGAVAAAQAKAVAAAAAAAAAAGAPPPPPPPVAALDIHASALLHFMEAGVAEPAFTARAGRVAAFVAAPLGDGGAAAAVAIASSQLRERDGGGMDLIAWPVAPSPPGRAGGGVSPWWAAGDGDGDTAAVRVFAATRPSDAGPHSIVSVAAASAALTAVSGDVGLPWARRVAAMVSGGGGGGNDHPRSPSSPPPPPHPVEWYVTTSQCALRVEPAGGGAPASAAAAALTCGAAVARGGPTHADAASLALHDVSLLLADAGAPGHRDAWRPHATADASLACALAAAGHTLVASQRELAVSTRVDGSTRHVGVTGARVRGTVGAAACRLARAVPRSERDDARPPPPPAATSTPTTPPHPLAGIVDDALAPRQPSTPRSPRRSADEWHTIDAAFSPPSPPPDEGRGVWLDCGDVDGGHLRSRNGVTVVDDFVRVGGGGGWQQWRASTGHSAT